MARPKNLYELLGIPQTATSEEIKHAYRVLAMKWHPDRNTSAEAEERFKEINFAYSVLSDSVRRAEYDRNFEESTASSRDQKFTEEDAARIFLEAIFDMAFTLASAGYDENFIYRALVQEGCPDTIAAACARSACKKVAVPPTHREFSAPSGASASSASGQLGHTQSSSTSLTSKSSTAGTQALVVALFSVIGMLFGILFRTADAIFLGGIAALVLGLVALPSVRKTSLFQRFAAKAEYATRGFLFSSVAIFIVASTLTENKDGIDWKAVDPSLAFSQWRAEYIALTAMFYAALSATLILILYRLGSGRHYANCFVISYSAVGLILTTIFAIQFKQEFQVAKERVFQERQHQTAIANEKKLVEQTIARLERDYPFINPNSPQYRQDVVDRINLQIDRLTKQGLPSHQAIERGTNEVIHPPSKRR